MWFQIKFTKFQSSEETENRINESLYDDQEDAQLPIVTQFQEGWQSSHYHKPTERRVMTPSSEKLNGLQNSAYDKVVPKVHHSKIAQYKRAVS